MRKSEVNTGISRRTIQRWVGLSLLAYVVVVAVQVVTRAVSYDSQAPFHEAMGMIAENHRLYLTSMYSGLVANVIFIAVAAGVYSSLTQHDNFLALLGAMLFLGAAIVSMVSAAAGLVVASEAAELAAMPVTGGIVLGDATIELLRENTGRVGFTLSALGVMVFGVFIAGSGTLPRWLGWAGILAALMMFFIWLDVPPIIHRLGGLGYLLWLAILGGWLLATSARPMSEKQLTGS